MRVPQSNVSRRPRRRLLRATVALAMLGGLGAYAAVYYERGPDQPPHCTVADRDHGGEPYVLQPRQAANAATIGVVGNSRELPERAVTIAIATAMQESSLFNLNHGDRDSLGLFQQRPSMGWGTEEEIMDPVYSSGQFYDHLVLVPDYLDLPLTVAAQEVQRSAFPDEYAKHEPSASLLAAALTGRSAAALSCTSGTAELPVADQREVVALLERDFGSALETRPEDGSIAVRVPAGGQAERGWELAHWSIAQATSLGIAEIAYDGHVWTASRADLGWRAAEDAAGPPELVLRLNGSP